MTFRIFLLAAMAAVSTLADGGTIQLRTQAGPFVITLFSDATPVRAGQKVDLSVLCERVADKQAVKNAQVLIHLRRPGAGDIMEFVLPAKKSETKSGILYAAAAKLPTSGKWPVRIDARAGSDEATVTGILDVQPEQPAVVTYWPFFVAVPLLALMFAINLRIRRGRRLRARK